MIARPSAGLYDRLRDRAAGPPPRSRCWPPRARSARPRSRWRSTRPWCGRRRAPCPPAGRRPRGRRAPPRAATRLTSDSSASERRPTEPVSRYAPPLSPIVTSAATTEMAAKRSSPRRSITAACSRQHPGHLGDGERRASFGAVVHQEVGGNPGLHRGVDQPQEVPRGARDWGPGSGRTGRTRPPPRRRSGPGRSSARATMNGPDRAPGRSSWSPIAGMRVQELKTWATPCSRSTAKYMGVRNSSFRTSTA